MFKPFVAMTGALALLLGGMALVPASAGAAGWISQTDSFAAAWVREVEQELSKQDYRAMFLNDPRTPQAAVLQRLNQAAMAFNEKNEALGEQFVREAIDVLEAGVTKRYYSQADIEPLVTFIKQHAPGKKV
jgi:hypothetical protein